VDLVIFDCDGVLIDSEVLAIRVEAALLAEFGIAITEDEIADRYCGLSMAAMVADLEARHRRPLGAGFAARHGARFAAACAAGLQAIDGVAVALDAIAGRVCVASSSAPERLRHTLGLVGLYDRFAPHVFSATMVARGKPAPDLFLLAAERMGAAPAHCAVVEDSAPGIAAAVAAGMTPVGFAGGGHCRDGHSERLRAAGAAVVVSRMAELPATLARLSSRRLR